MRRKAILSVMVLYHHDNSIFDELLLPTGHTPIEGLNYVDAFTPDKDALIAEILEETSEMQSLYTSPDTLKESIKYWSRRNFHRWQKLYDSVCYAYNPIWNVDGTTSRTAQRDSTATYSKQGDEDTTGTRGTASDNVHSVSAFNSTDWQRSDRDQGTEDVNYTESKPWTESGDDGGSITETETERRTGNAGITMTQQMIEKEREIAEYDFYGVIARDFKKRFCVMVY